jgi:hypothetical protein
MMMPSFPIFQRSQSAVAMVPRQIWKHPLLSAAMRGASPGTKFIPIPQCNATVINCHLIEFSRQARRLQRQFTGTSLATWMEKLHPINQENAWRYLAMLEKCF